jgi:hypothetical protein
MKITDLMGMKFYRKRIQSWAKIRYCDANGWTISGTGQWLPTFNYGNTGEQMAYLLFTNTKYDRAQLTTVSVELTEQNGTKMLKISELDKNTFEYYRRKQ